MAILNEGRKVIVDCDSCSAQFSGEIDEDFGEVLAAARREGWKVARIDDQWLHGCPKCGRPT